MTTTTMVSREQPQRVRFVLLSILLLSVLVALVVVVHRPGVPDPSVGQPFTATITRLSYDQTAVCYTGSPTRDGPNCTVLYHQEPVAVGQQVQGVEIWFPGREGMVQALAVNGHY